MWHKVGTIPKFKLKTLSAPWKSNLGSMLERGEERVSHEEEQRGEGEGEEVKNKTKGVGRKSSIP